MATNDQTTSAPASGIVPFTTWYRELGVSERTAHRYRARGMIEVLNIYGKLYVSREQIGLFEARVEAGEFAQERGRRIAAHA